MAETNGNGPKTFRTRVIESDGLLALNRISGPALLAVMAFCGIQLWSLAQTSSSHTTALTLVQQHLDRIDQWFVDGRARRDTQVAGIEIRVASLESSRDLFRSQIDDVREWVRSHSPLIGKH